MGGKDKTVSFRVKEEMFEDLQSVSGRMEPSLSQIFRDFVSVFNEHEGHVSAVPAHEVPSESSDDSFPQKVEVTTGMIREHERLELEAEHLREAVSEYRQHATELENTVEELESREADMILLEDLDSVSNFHVTTD